MGKDFLTDGANLRKWSDERPVGDTFETKVCFQAKLYTIPWYAMIWWRLRDRWWSPLHWALWPYDRWRRAREDAEFNRLQLASLKEWNLTLGSQLDALEDWFLDNHDKTKCNMWDALKEQEKSSE